MPWEKFMQNLNRPYSTPIVFIFFNRPNHITEATSILKKIKPEKIYLVADGPRNKKEAPLVRKTRKLVEKNITWSPEIIKIYSSKNMGLRNRIVSGLNQVFEKEEKAIILEDDCIANPSFFKFCDQLLKKYKNNRHIGSIAGTNFLFNKKNPSSSYYFSKYPHSWGWATWKRAWNLFDNEMSGWKQVWNDHSHTSLFLKWYWYLIFSTVSKLKIDSWAYRWTYSCWKHKLLTVIPQQNLVKNVGFNSNATNTKFKSSVLSMKTSSLNFPLKHPEKIKQNSFLDKITENNLYFKPRTIIGAMIKYLK